jgi:hypothetical protein
MNSESALQGEGTETQIKLNEEGTYQIAAFKV